MSKLSRITKIRHRVFRDFEWPKDLHEFGQFNLIYGWNGCGKTTLSSLLALAEKRTALTDGEIELEFDGTTMVAGAAFASAQIPQVRVFNRDFITATLQSTGDIAPIYYLGEGSAEKQAQVVLLKKDLSRANTEVVTATSGKKDAETKLDDFCVAQAKLIKGVLTTGNSTTYNNYNKAKFKQAAQELTAQAAAASILSVQQQVSLRSQKDAQPKPPINRVSVPTVDLAALAQEVDALSSRRVVAETLDELTDNANLASWIERGLGLHSGELASDTCRFCRHPFEAGRRATLEAHFNDAFAGFQQDLVALLSKLKAAEQSLKLIAVPDLSRFYDHSLGEATSAIALLKADTVMLGAALDALVVRVEAKREAPFAPVELASSSREGPNTLSHAIATLNAAIDKHNKTTDDFKSSVDEACKLLENAYVADAYVEYVQLAETLRGAQATLENLKDKPVTVQGEISKLELEILEHRRPADELTKELCAYLGRDELRFEVKDTGYVLTRSGQPVFHLSEGERTAITFLYFLKSLQDKDFDMANGVVVIDDPVSSLDANALFSAFGYMKERTKKCGQLFIFTHSFPLFRQVKNWFHHQPKQNSKKVEIRPSRFYLLRAHRGADGERTSELCPLDPLLESHNSEYEFLFKCVYSESQRTGAAELERYYGIANVARRLVEAFLAFRYPAVKDDLKARLDEVPFDSAAKTRILRLLHTQSHAPVLGQPEHDASALSETPAVLADVLAMMREADPGHFAGLVALASPPGGEPS